MTTVNYNERSWAIDLISDINLWLASKNILIKRAGGENTLQSSGESFFPDILLFGDIDKGRILLGWELKMPDTALENEEFIRNAKKKAELLSLNSFLLWNVSSAVLYRIEEEGSLSKIKHWGNLSSLRRRDEVVQHMGDIKKMLVEILTDLNEYISAGTIKSTSIVKVLTSEAVYELLQKNTSSYIQALRTVSQTDIDLLTQITLWWRYAKNDYPEEQDKFAVLARNNLLYLVNKFLFAHILKSYQSDASVVDKISHKTDIITALNLFTEISRKCDFWNIFQKQKGEELITMAAWQDILSFNDLLKEFSFANIEKSLLHDLLDMAVYKNKRKYAGQFTTPPELAKFAATLTIQDKKLHAIDPCCGTGTIVKEIYKMKKSVIGIEESLKTLWASDKFSLPLQMAMFNLADPEALGYVLKVFKEDASKLIVGQNIEFHEPFNGVTVNELLPSFSYIVSNLPFVQQEDLKELNPDITEINSLITEKLGAENKLDCRSDLYAYLPFYFWSLLDQGGCLTIIVSNSWLGTAWGERFYKVLSGFYKIKSIITSGHGRWFSNAKVVTNLITLEKRISIALPGKEESIKFAVTNKKLNEYTPEVLEEISAIIISRETCSEDDVSLQSYTREQMDDIKILGLNLNSFFVDTTWILKFSNVLVNIADYFDIARGERRGWDKMFYPNVSNTIENCYIKPVLKTPRSVNGLITAPDAIAFCCDKTKDELVKLGHKGALAWIHKFEGQNNEEGVPLTISLARKDIPWYTMQPSTMADIVTGINFGDRLFFARFNEPTFVNQRLVRFSKKSENIDHRLCHALLNSIISLFYLEAMGTGRGEGALDLSKDKIEKDLHIINPQLITSENREKILNLFEIMEGREIYPIEEELEKEDRNSFDNAVLDAVGCLAFKGQIKKSLLSLHRIRTSVND